MKNKTKQLFYNHVFVVGVDVLSYFRWTKADSQGWPKYYI